MQPEYWDISLPLCAGIPTWPGSSGFCLRRVQDIGAGDAVNESDIAINAHAGTHIEA